MKTDCDPCPSRRALRTVPHARALAVGIVGVLLAARLDPAPTPALAAEPVVLTIGSIVPSQSVWADTLRKAVAEMEERSGGQLRVKMYLGGVLGDDADMIAKMTEGTLDASGLMAVGVEQIVPEMTVLEMPFLFSSLQQVDQLRTWFIETFEAAYHKRGYKLLALLDAGGFTQLYAKEKIETLTDLRRQKVFTWRGSRVHAETFRAMGIEPIPLPPPDVLPELLAGRITVVNSTPLATVALQWHTKIQYVLRVDLRYEPAAVVIRLESWHKLTQAQRKLMLDMFAKYTGPLVTEARRSDDLALFGLVKKARKTILPSAKLREEMREATRDLPERFVQAGLFDAALNERVRLRVAEAVVP
ncbi:MAG: TRAP transporter substrate-binding protein DctP [Nitrospirae bacterium]|nr:TRAP transporter substrate-binding protein DctP [Nitrospirota bacterium]